MKKQKQAAFLVPQIGFNEIELYSIKNILQKNNIKCTIASYAKGKIIGKYGKQAKAIELIPKINHEDYDCFIFVGGMTVSSLAEYSQVQELLKAANKENKLIVFLCMHSAIFLEYLDFLKGKKMTVFKAKNPWCVNIIKQEAVYVDEPIVIDENIITCRDEKDASLLAEKIAQILK